MALMLRSRSINIDTIPLDDWSPAGVRVASPNTIWTCVIAAAAAAAVINV